MKEPLPLGDEEQSDLERVLKNIEQYAHRLEVRERFYNATGCRPSSQEVDTIIEVEREMGKVTEDKEAAARLLRRLHENE